MRPYVPLHLHTEYSILDGATRIKDLIKIAQANNMPAVAITDHGVMYGAIELYRECKGSGVKPIIGCEVYIIDGDMRKHEKEPYKHLILLCKDQTGYKNLTKMVSQSQLEGFYYKPRISKSLLKEHSAGLVALSSCLSGELHQNLSKGNYEKAKEAAFAYQELFGEDFYIELQDHGIPQQLQNNPQLVKLSKETGIELVITNDSHYTKQSDWAAHDILLCLQTGKKRADKDRMKFANDQFYVKNGDELAQMFKNLDPADIEKAIQNTLVIADKCHLEIDMGGRVDLPDFPVPEGHTLESYLRAMAQLGMSEKYPDITEDIKARFEYEANLIESMGFAAYFLIVWDFIKYAKDNGIPVGPGRGSAAGSLIAYSLGITDLDPIAHNLLFERFLNPERISMPDVDIDFCIEKRDQVITYVAEKYGSDKVCQIITFGTLAARAAIKGVARVLDIPYEEADRLAKMIPTTVGVKIEDALQEGMELKKLYDSKDYMKEWVDLAQSIEGLNCNIGTHAAGVIISKYPLDELVPLNKSKEGQIVTQYPMGDLEKVGLLKMDFLGLRNLTIIKNTLDILKEQKDIDIDISKIPLDDPKVYAMLSAGDTNGVFQLESSGMKALVKDLKPSVFEDLGALVSLFRPGPLNSGMVKEFVNRKHGRSHITYSHESLEPILKDTYGTIVYQEQIMQIAQTLAGYSLGQADILRKAMGKKIPEEMEKQRAIFLEGTSQNNVDNKSAEELFNAMAEFAAYCFNRSHAAAYGLLAYQTGYLKAHYPVEYMSALISSVRTQQDKIQQYIEDCQRMGIEVLPPDINESGSDFTPVDYKIRFGLASVKNVGVGVVEQIIKERKSNGSFKSFYDFCCRIDQKVKNKKTLESLVNAGAFESLEKSRKQVYQSIEEAIQQSNMESKTKAAGQINLFESLGNPEDLADSLSFKLVGAEEEYPEEEIQKLEKDLLGFYLTSHPLSSIAKNLVYVTTHQLKDLKEEPEGSFVAIGGLITSVRKIITKSNKPMRVAILEDMSGTVEVVVFNSILEKAEDLVEEGQKVVIKAKTKHSTTDDDIVVSVVAEDIHPIEDAQVVHVNFDNEPSIENIHALKNILLSHKGNDPVVIEFISRNQDIKILTGSQFWVHSSRDLTQYIDELPGAKAELLSLV